MQHDVDSIARFYCELVELPSHGVTDGSGSVAEMQWQHSVPQEPAAAFVDSAARHHAAVPVLPHAGAAAADTSVLLKPVKFAQPVILDPNTSMMTLPPKAAAAPAVTVAPGVGSSARYRRRDTRSSTKGQPSPLDLSLQASRYCASSNSTAAPAIAAPGPTSSLKRPIERSNIGFQLLQRAGWQEGKGLGAHEHGMAAPLQAVANKGNKGLGFGAHQQQQQQSAALQKHSAIVATETTTSAPAMGPVLGSKRVAALVNAELAAEDVEAKVKRHRQVMQQEARDKRDKAIQEHLYRAFNEISDYGTGDHNPLGRSHRLTATNPLLD